MCKSFFKSVFLFTEERTSVKALDDYFFLLKNVITEPHDTIMCEVFVNCSFSPNNVGDYSIKQSCVKDFL